MADAPSQVERAYDQVVEWLEHFEDLEDPRQSGKVAYPLAEMLLQCLFAVLAGADSWVDVALFGRNKLAFLRRFAAFEHGTPSHDQFGNLFAALNAEGSRNASSPGSPRSPSSGPKSLRSMARRCGAPIRKAAPRPRFT